MRQAGCYLRPLRLAAGLAALLASSAGDEGACSADAPEGSCRADATDALEDGIAEDVKKLCPLTGSRVAPGAQFLFRMLTAMTGALKWVGLWPSGISPADWADDYFVVNYVIVARILIGLYKTRDKEYVNVPTDQMGDDDVVHVEHIYAPHYDVDGSPNFYWFESMLPNFLKRRFYVPLMTCFYSSLRRLATTDGTLFGTFEDNLNDASKNTWEVVLRSGDFKSKRDWVMHFYDTARAWDGVPLWPTQMVDLAAYKKRDIWDDRLEHAMAFHLIGSHRLESGAWTFKDVGGSESLTLPFRIPLNMFSAFEVREHFGRFGADLYFNEDGMPVLLQTPDGRLVARGDKDWQYWKFVWRSTLVTGITLVDHLHIAHFRTGNFLARASRTAFPPDHPMRRFMSIFTFGTIFVNVQAMHQLIGPNHMLHRATPFKDFAKLSRIVPAGESGLIVDIPDTRGIKELVNDTAWDALHPRLKETPYYADGRLIVKAMKKFLGAIAPAFKSVLCKDDQASTPEFNQLREHLLNWTSQAHYKAPPELWNVYMRAPCKKIAEMLPERFVSYFYTVTGWHRQVGFVGDYYGDPELATMSWKNGEPYGRPNQHMIMTVVNVFTSTRQPKIVEDYTHLFKGMKPDLGAEMTKAWRDFQGDLKEVEAEIDRRNKKREIPNINMSPRTLEVAISK